jgi:PAS domain S-box-containing protein
MGKPSQTEAELRSELAELRRRLSELEDVAEDQARLEERLHLERQQLMSIFDSMDEPVYVSDPDTYELLYANDVLRERFGDVAGQKCHELLQGLDSPCPFCTNKYLFGDSAVETYVWEWQSELDGRWYRCVDRPVRWPGGRMVRCEMAIDITDRVQAEEGLRQSERNFRELADNASDGILIGTADGDYVYANRQVAEITGYELDELARMGIRDLVHPDDLHAVLENYNKRLEGRPAPRHYETRLVHKNGAQIQVELAGARTIWQGQPADLITIRDITERKRAEEELRRLNRALKMVSECNQALVRAKSEEELLPDICWIAVEHGGYRLAWVGYAEQDEAKTVRPVAQMGYDEGYVGRTDITWADTERGRGPTGTAIRTGEPSLITNILGDPAYAPWRDEAAKRGYQSSISLPLVAEGGTLGALNIYASEPDAFDAAEVSMLMELARDLGYGIQALRDREEREKAEADLKKYSERLEEMVEGRTRELRAAQDELVRAEKLAVLGELAGGVGHELRNPLGVISNAVYYLQATLADANETTAEYLKIIASQVKTAGRIISDLLDFAQTPQPDKERTLVLALVGQVLESQSLPSSVQMVTEIPAGLPPVLVDPRQIGQVLQNLVTNAYQAMPEGGRLTISARSDRHYVELSVADTGIGISPQDIERLFEPLFTTKARGIGLGLPVCRQLVEANGGTIATESTEGHGTTMTVSLPRADG